MTRWLAILMAVAVSLLCPSQVRAQGSFSGRWTLMPERSTAQLPDGQSALISVLGSDLTIQQTPDRLIVAQPNAHPPRWVVMLDGSESRVGSIRGDIGAKDDNTYRGEWRGDVRYPCDGNANLE
jgi:hypothetical protein